MDTAPRDGTPINVGDGAPGERYLATVFWEDGIWWETEGYGADGALNKEREYHDPVSWWPVLAALRPT
jgi:hypothetical protein